MELVSAGSPSSTIMYSGFFLTNALEISISHFRPNPASVKEIFNLCGVFALSEPSAYAFSA